jgi:hypothetical protein
LIELTQRFQVYGQKNRTQKDTSLIYLRSMFLPNPGFVLSGQNKQEQAIDPIVEQGDELNESLVVLND